MRLRPNILWFLLLTSAVIGCDECREVGECSLFDSTPSIAFMSTTGVDLLDSLNVNAIDNLRIRSLDNPDYDFDFVVTSSVGGTIQGTANLLSIINDDTYVPDQDGGYSEKTWIIEYTRASSSIADTINVTPVDNNIECCVSLSSTEFKYKGGNVVAVERIPAINGYEVVLED